MRLFDHDGDYAAFERVLAEGCRQVPMRLLAYCLMPNHWHLVLWPFRDETVSRFVAWVTTTHTKRWHGYRNSVGTGHVYQGRFKSFLVQDDAHYLAVCRYVERNAVRAKLVARAEEWRWSSLGRRSASQHIVPVSEGPVSRPPDWVQWVNDREADDQVTAIRRSIVKGRPYGTEKWVTQMVVQWRLEKTVRGAGRPKLTPENSA
jgi:putative transposase